MGMPGWPEFACPAISFPVVLGLPLPGTDYVVAGIAAIEYS
jgi:hypothetical protein